MSYSSYSFPFLFDVNDTYEDGNTRLINSIRNNKYDEFKKLLDWKADPNLPNKNGTTPLIYAVMRNDLTIIIDLLKHGADPNKNAILCNLTLWNNSDSDIDIYIKIIETLLEYGLKIDIDINCCAKILFTCMFSDDSRLEKLAHKILGLNIDKKVFSTILTKHVMGYFHLNIKNSGSYNNVYLYGKPINPKILSKYLKILVELYGENIYNIKDSKKNSLLYVYINYCDRNIIKIDLDLIKFLISYSKFVSYNKLINKISNISKKPSEKEILDLKNFLNTLNNVISVDKILPLCINKESHTTLEEFEDFYDTIVIEDQYGKKHCVSREDIIKTSKIELENINKYLDGVYRDIQYPIPSYINTIPGKRAYSLYLPRIVYIDDIKQIKDIKDLNSYFYFKLTNERKEQLTTQIGNLRNETSSIFTLNPIYQYKDLFNKNNFGTIQGHKKSKSKTKSRTINNIKNYKSRTKSRTFF